VRPRLPRPLHRLALRGAQGLRLAWWRVRRPDLHGCNAIVFNEGGEVLLVRHSYQSPGRWMLPGGGLASGESAVAAAAREVAEETGCRIADARFIGVEVAAVSGARNHIHLVVARTADNAAADRREIVEAAFFAPEALPPTITAAARRRIGRAMNQNSAS
jgi:8-oxo-dGTP pyrophosphatase MutT (NUDIX family)